MNKFNVIACAALVVVATTACTKKELTERPPILGDTLTFATMPSTIGTLVSLPISDLKALINAQVPPSFSERGNGPDVCVNLLFTKACAGTQYQFTATRAGDISVVPVGPGTLRLSVPIEFSGNGGLRGTGAELLKLDVKSFRGGLVLIADITPKLRADWCPELDLKPTYQWTSAPAVEIVGGAWVDVKGQVQGALDKAIPTMIEQVKTAVDCGKFKSGVEKLYATQSFPIETPQFGKIYANVVPQGIGFSGIAVGEDAVKAAITLTTKVDISTQPLTSEQLPLPGLNSIASTEPKTTIALPVRAPYGVITQHIQQAVVGKTFEQNTPLGPLAVKVNGVEVYPSGANVVVGVDMEATTPSPAPNAKGKIYLLGKPATDGTVIHLSDVRYSTVLDSAFWQVASTVFEGQIRSAITKAATHDLSNEISKGKEAIEKALRHSNAQAGFAVTLRNVDMKLGRIAAGANEFVVEGIFSAAASVEVKP